MDHTNPHVHSLCLRGRSPETPSDISIFNLSTRPMPALQKAPTSVDAFHSSTDPHREVLIVRIGVHLKIDLERAGVKCSHLVTQENVFR